MQQCPHDLQMERTAMTAHQLGRKTTDKICLFIDNNSLSAALTGRKVNFQRLREWLVGHREAVVSRVYCGEISNDDRTSFYHYLKQVGFEVVACRNSRSRSRSASSDCELSRAISCQMAWDICEALSQGWYSSIVIVSGGFEMAEIASHVRERGTEVEIAFPSESCSSTLKSRATLFRPFLTEFTISERNSKEKVLS